MDISSVNSDLIRGNVTTIILGCLREGDKYGYEIMKEIEDKSNSQYVLKQATLYNQLKRLEKQGLVSSYDGDPDDTGGGKRKYYTLTQEGKAFLKKEKSEYEYSRTILDKLVSSDEYDFTVPIPFVASELRPYSKVEDKPKVVYKDKIVEKIVEKKVFFDRYGNEVNEEDADALKQQALQDDEQARLAEEQYKQIEEQSRLKDEQIQKSEEEAKQKEEQLRQTEEQLRKSEEDREIVKSMLRQMEEEKIRAQEAQRIKEEEEKRRQEEEAKRLEEEAERKRQEQAKPAQTLEEMFAKLDAESEYKRQQDATPLYRYDKVEPEEHTYINGFTNQVEHSSRSQTSLKDIFKQLDEKEAQIDDKLAKEQQEIEILRAYEEAKEAEKHIPTKQEYDEYIATLEGRNQNFSAPGDKGQFVTSAVVNRQEGGFDYEKDDVNYREFFVSIAEQNNQPIENEEKPQQVDYSDSDIKTRLYAKGFKIRPYDRGNTSEYYTFNFIQSNRLNRDTFLIILAFFVVEVAIMWVSLFSRISYAYFLPILLCGSALCLVPTVIYMMNPTKRTRANFNFKLSILNRTMLFIELTVVCILIGFFALGANVNDIDLILSSIVLPMVLLTNLPLSSLIYWLLYRTHKYHTA